MQLKQQQEQQVTQNQQHRQHQYQSHPSSSSDPERQHAATVTFVEETQRELQGQKQKTAFRVDLKTLSFPSVVSSLSSSTSVATTSVKKSKLVVREATATAIAMDDVIQLPAFGSSQGSASSSIFSSSSSNLQPRRTALQPPHSATSLASLLGVDSYFGGTPTSLASNLVATSFDTKAMPSPFGFSSSSKSAAGMVERMADLSKGCAAALSLIALRDIKVFVNGESAYMTCFSERECLLSNAAFYNYPPMRIQYIFAGARVHQYLSDPLSPLQKTQVPAEYSIAGAAGAALPRLVASASSNMSDSAKAITNELWERQDGTVTAHVRMLLDAQRHKAVPLPSQMTSNGTLSKLE